MIDHVHMLISIPPKHSVSHIVGFLKGKSSIWVAQTINNRQKNFVGQKFWARGYFVVSVGNVNSEEVQRYIEQQEEHHKKKTFKEEYDEIIEKYNIFIIVFLSNFI